MAEEVWSVYSFNFQNGHMKRKIILLALSLSSVGMAYANSPIEPEPCNGPSPCKSAIGKKNNLAGQVMHAEKKNPLKDVSVTAYNASKKEKDGVYRSGRWLFIR